MSTATNPNSHLSTQKDPLQWLNETAHMTIDNYKTLEDGVILVNVVSQLTKQKFAFNCQPKNVFQRIENFSALFTQVRNFYKHDCAENIMRMVSGDEKEIADFVSTLHRVSSFGPDREKFGIYIAKRLKLGTAIESNCELMIQLAKRRQISTPERRDSPVRSSLTNAFNQINSPNKTNSPDKLKISSPGYTVSELSDSADKETPHNEESEAIFAVEEEETIVHHRRKSDPREMKVQFDDGFTDKKRSRVSVCFGATNVSKPVMYSLEEESTNTTTEAETSEDSDCGSVASFRDEKDDFDKFENFSKFAKDESSDEKQEKNEKQERYSKYIDVGRKAKRAEVNFLSSFEKELIVVLDKQKREQKERGDTGEKLRFVLKELVENKQKNETIKVHHRNDKQVQYNAFSARLQKNETRTSLHNDGMLSSIPVRKNFLGRKERTLRRQSCMLRQQVLEPVTSKTANPERWRGKNYNDCDIEHVKSIQWFIKHRKAAKEGVRVIKKMRERKAAVFEMINNEEHFMDCMIILNEMLEFFIENKCGAVFDLAKKYLEKVTLCTQKLEDKIAKIVKVDKMYYGEGIPQIYNEVFDSFNDYAFFINLYKRLMNDYDDLTNALNTKECIQQYVLKLKVEKKMDFDMLVSMPFQHIMRYKIQINRIIETLQNNDKLFIPMNEALSKVSDVICNVNDQYKSVAQSTELNTVISHMSVGLEKTLFGRTVVGMTRAQITKLREKDLVKSKTGKRYKKCFALIISDAVIFLTNKSICDSDKVTLSDLADKKKLQVETIAYFDNVVLMPFSVNELHFSVQGDYLVKFVDMKEMEFFIQQVETARSGLWLNYNSVLKSIKADKYPFFSMELEDVTFHSDALVNRANLVHAVLSGIYVFVYKSTSDFVNKNKPLHTLNIFENPVSFTCDSVGMTVFVCFDMPDNKLQLQMQSLQLGMLWINCIRNEMQAFITANKAILPIEPKSPRGINAWYVWKILPNINGNDKCFICKKFTSVVDIGSGKFYCIDCAKLIKSSTLFEMSRTAIVLLASLTKDTRPILAGGNDVLKALA
ncbi:hypothetical protein EIN_314890 [Entamoeba invadens IP1]|uniref:DH domain-containing protein n=1 Tax=Entamoeba invadens IP1 TaxID=370355 RepID=A0A0A1TZA2_ENTIV|nr:hypothetical protein EIN_314890 [Entamoeba invadens IP1]ELP86920.1 hypothetical protein EIN_314890 [Entamoeba invadens IP1]|eukprot:XP_004253691.1 hypothetical protein EIN_314890 [Entamoeba invadens IP1]